MVGAAISVDSKAGGVTVTARSSVTVLILFVTAFIIFPFVVISEATVMILR